MLLSITRRGTTSASSTTLTPPVGARRLSTLSLLLAASSASSSPLALSSSSSSSSLSSSPPLFHSSSLLPLVPQRAFAKPVKGGGGGGGAGKKKKLKPTSLQSLARERVPHLSAVYPYADVRLFDKQHPAWLANVGYKQRREELDPRTKQYWKLLRRQRIKKNNEIKALTGERASDKMLELYPDAYRRSAFRTRDDVDEYFAVNYLGRSPRATTTATTATTATK